MTVLRLVTHAGQATTATMEFTLSIVTIYMATGLSFNDLTKIVTLKQQIF